MAIIDNLKKLINKEEKNDEKEIVEKLAKSYQDKKEKGEENPIDTTVSQIMDIINNSETPEATAKKILVAALDTRKYA